MTLKQIRIRFYITFLIAAVLGATAPSYNSQFFLALGVAGIAGYWLKRWADVQRVSSR